MSRTTLFYCNLLLIVVAVIVVTVATNPGVILVNGIVIGMNIVLAGYNAKLINFEKQIAEAAYEATKELRALIDKFGMSTHIKINIGDSEKEN